MRIHVQSLPYPPWLLLLVGLPLAITAILLAVFFFTFFLIFFVLAMLVVGLRLWWLRRKLRQAQPSSSTTALETEYEVVSRTRSQDSEPK